MKSRRVSVSILPMRKRQDYPTSPPSLLYHPLVHAAHLIPQAHHNTELQNLVLFVVVQAREAASRGTASGKRLHTPTRAQGPTRVPDEPGFAWVSQRERTKHSPLPTSQAAARPTCAPNRHLSCSALAPACFASRCEREGKQNWGNRWRPAATIFVNAAG